MNRMEHDDYRNEPELNQAACPECGAPLQNDEVWLKRGNTGYFTRATCHAAGTNTCGSSSAAAMVCIGTLPAASTPPQIRRPLGQKQKAALLERMKKRRKDKKSRLRLGRSFLLRP